MTQNTILLKLILPLSITIIISSCDQATNGRKHNMSQSFLTPDIDSSMIAIISFKDFAFVFDSSYRETTLTAQDLKEIERLIRKCIYTYNKSFSKNDGQSDGLQDGFRQYIAVVNSKGEKEVWINCFCTTDDENWKKSVVSVMDGGGCYYNLKINLTTKKYYDLSVNGIA